MRAFLEASEASRIPKWEGTISRTVDSIYINIKEISKNNGCKDAKLNPKSSVLSWGVGEFKRWKGRRRRWFCKVIVNILEQHQHH